MKRFEDHTTYQLKVLRSSEVVEVIPSLLEEEKKSSGSALD
jgi:hypothetical protein